MDRFSKDKRIGNISMQEFTTAAKSILTEVRKNFSDFSAEVLCCEDSITHFWAECSFPTPQKTAALENRRSYKLEDVSEAIWQQSYKISLCVHIPTSQSGMIMLSVNRAKEPKRLMFYSQGLDGTASAEHIERINGRASLNFSIGDGFTARPSRATQHEAFRNMSFWARENSR